MALTKISRSLLNTGVSDSSDATAITITSDEKIGIGTTSPAAKVEINGDGELLRLDGTGGAARSMRFRGLSTSTPAFITVDGSFKLHCEDSGTHMEFHTADTERMRIDGSGNVGIGTTNGDVTSDGVSSRTYVAILGSGNRGVLNLGTTASAGADGGKLSFVNGSNVTGEISCDPDSGSATHGNLAFNTTNSQRMKITSGGNIGIGLTNPSSPLHVRVGTNNNFEIEETGGDLRLLAINDARNANVRMEFAASAFQFLTGNVTIDGSITKGSGSFKINHPLESKKNTHNLVHSFVEAPQADNIYRGVVSLENGSATINLDTVSGMTEGTYVLLNTNTQCFTSNETDWDAVKGSVTGNILTISCENVASTATVSWLVIGERHDQHMIDTDWTDENGKVIVEPLKNE